MNEATAMELSARAMKLWPASFNAEHAAVMTDRLRRMDIDAKQVNVILDEELVAPTPKASRIAGVMARLRNADQGGRKGFVAGDEKHGTPEPALTWRDEWRQRLGLPADAMDATVLEAWARYQWAACRHLDTTRRLAILRLILRELARSWGTDAAAREACREILNLKPENRELAARFGTAQSAQEAT